MALSTVSRWLKRIGLGKRSRLEPPEPPNRYERKRPGELIHVDIKKLGRIGAAGKRVTGNRQASRGYGWEFVHVCVDDATRLAYVEVLPDERGETAVGVPAPGGRVVAERGVSVERVMTDNGSCYVSHRPRRRPAGSSGCATSAPGPTGRAPTARPSASSRRCCASGPTARIYGCSAERAARSPAGSTTTTTDDKHGSLGHRPRSSARRTAREQPH